VLLDLETEPPSETPLLKKKKADVRRFMRKVRKPQILKRQILGGLIASLCIGVNMVITASTVSFVQAVLAERCHQ